MRVLRRRILFSGFCAVSLLGLAAAPPARPQAAPPPPAGNSQAGFETVPVEVDGRVLFNLRGMQGYPASRRAGLVKQRIVDLAKDSAFSVQSLAMEAEEHYTRITGGDELIVNLFDSDGEIEGLPREVLAGIYLARIEETIDLYRLERTGEYRLRGAVRAAIATVLILAVLFFCFRLVRWLGRVIERRLNRPMKSLESVSHKILRADRFFRILNSLLRLASVLIVLLLVYLYLHYLFGIFAETRGFGNRMLALITSPLVRIGEAVLNYIPKLIFLIFLIVAVRYLVKALKRFFNSVESGKIHLSDFDPEWASPTFRIIRLVVIALGVVLAYPYIPGSDSAAFKGVSIFLGVIFSLGSTSVIANIMAGYSMIYRRAFKVGDRVRINESVGDVTEMRLLVTHLRSIKNEEIIIPNSTVLTSEIVNYSALAATDGLILHTTVGIGYDTPWRQVEAILLEAASRTPGILKAPEPFVLQTGLLDHCVTYELNAYCGDAARMVPLYSELHENILDVFNEHGVQIMSPRYIADPAEPKVVPKGAWYPPPAKPAGTGGDRPQPSSPPGE